MFNENGNATTHTKELKAFLQEMVYTVFCKSRATDFTDEEIDELIGNVANSYVDRLACWNEKAQYTELSVDIDNLKFRERVLEEIDNIRENRTLSDKFVKGDLENTGGNCWCVWAKIGKYWFFGSANGGGAYYKTKESAMASWGSSSENFVRDVTDKEELFHIHQDILNYCLRKGGDYSKSEYLFWLKDLYEYGATADEEITITVELEPNYCPGTDTTFIMKNTYADEEKTEHISAECVGWYRGEPTEEDTIIFANRNMKDF